ncbi:MAG: hypothetical protein PF503_23940 [Desulfobacula sp.]|jgi:hypothetical protein|nr:hypothetical protein [Desulfobacula sp.]
MEKKVEIDQEKKEDAGDAQLHNGYPDGESDIVIGFDFGTSSSKVVIQDSVLHIAYAVPFDSFACSGNNYLIPTKIFISSNGELNLAKQKFSYANLKIDFMENSFKVIFKSKTASQSITNIELTTGYIALVIQKARLWFLEHTEAIYRNKHIYWHINLGIPSESYNTKKIRSRFQAVIMASWRISRSKEPITIREVKKRLKEVNTIDLNANGSLWLSSDYINTHPEVIMEVVGYVRSPQRTRGLHLLVDIGASTLDTATFIIHSNDDEDIFPLLETRVENHGTMALHNCRIQALKNNLQNLLKEKRSIDPTMPLPDLAFYEIELDSNDLSEIDNKFFKKSSATIGEILRTTKQKRAPNATAWEKGLPVFICGGGGRLPSYKTMIKKLGSRIAKARTDTSDFIIKKIPKPDQLEAPDLSHEEYDRLAVAYGLSFSSDEIGTVIPENEIEDINMEKENFDYENRFIGKEMC